VVTGTAKHDLGGTTRVRDASSTLAWVRPLLPRFGITRVANVTGLDRIGIPVWMCIRPNGRSLSVSQGKGLTSELAEVSAIMESIEVHHSEYVAPPDVIAPWRTVRRRWAAVNPGDLEPGLGWRTYAETRDLSWIRGVDLATGEPVLVPHARICLDWSHPHPDQNLFAVTSTGLASGNHRTEALCHAIFEVVERDCEWRWERMSSAARRRRYLRADTIDVPMLRGLLDRFAAAEVAVRMWDMTSAVGIPAYGCHITDHGPAGRIGPYQGSGCHLSAPIALSRALTEAAQSRLTFIAGSRDDLYPSSYVARASAGGDSAVDEPTLDFRLRATPPLGSTFEEDLQTTLRLLAAAGFRRVVALDHTRPEFGIPVVMVVIPRMRETR
jgi:ribosomal protein S12 methylthiotransferase accessory factor